MKKLLSNFEGYYKELVLGPLFKLFEAVLELLVPIVVARIIDIGIKNSDKSYIISHGFLLLLIAILGAAAAMICQYYAVVVSGNFGKRLRAQTYKHVMKLSGGEISSIGTGRLITLITNDTNQIQNGINMSIRLASRAPFLAIGSIIMAMMLNWKIGLIFLISTPLIVFILYEIMKHTLPNYGKIQSGQDKMSRLTGENLAGIRVIRAFSRQEQEQAEYQGAAENLTDLTIRVGKVSSLLNPLTSVIINIAIIAIVWFGSQFANVGIIASGEIIALVSYMNQTLLALIVLANFIVLITRAIASAKRVSAVLEIEPSITAPELLLTEIADKRKEAIVFENVDFAYHKTSKEVLEGINFAVPSGETVGIIGGTGSGKTTIINVIMRYFDVSKGNVLIDGKNIKDYDPRELRKMIGLVPQKAVLFSGTVRDNIKISDPNASDDVIWRALESAQGDDFVRNLPEGLDSVIEESGKNLSGGQRQRLTIARALVRLPKILILDDSSSALDYATDAALRKALAQEKKNNPDMTVIIISQRTATIKNADRILVIDDGKLVGEGTHNQLIAQNEIYREICTSQGVEQENAGEAISE